MLRTNKKHVIRQGVLENFNEFQYNFLKKLKTVIAKKSNAGSITVEAAFVIPIVLLTVFALIYLSFYLHDICRIQSVMDLAMHKAGFAVKHEADIDTGETDYEKIGDRGIFYQLTGSTGDEEKQLRDYVNQQLVSGLFLVKISKVSVDLGKRKIKLSINTDTQVTMPGLKNLFKPYTSTVISGSYSVHNPAETIRCTEVILETGSKIKGVDKLKEKFEKIFGSD